MLIINVFKARDQIYIKALEPPIPSPPSRTPHPSNTQVCGDYGTDVW